MLILYEYTRSGVDDAVTFIDADVCIVNIFLMSLLLLLLLFEQLQKMTCYTIWYFIDAKCCCWLTLIFFFFINFSPCNMKVYHHHTIPCSDVW